LLQILFSIVYNSTDLVVMTNAYDLKMLTTCFTTVIALLKNSSSEQVHGNE
jgi:hypothetical protein